jgi:hypothetical protein
MTDAHSEHRLRAASVSTQLRNKLKYSMTLNALVGKQLIILGQADSNSKADTRLSTRNANGTNAERRRPK